MAIYDQVFRPMIPNPKTAIFIVDEFPSFWVIRVRPEVKDALSLQRGLQQGKSAFLGPESNPVTSQGAPARTSNNLIFMRKLEHLNQAV
ncbi:MAG TPA: hypothetical protein VM574_08580 [Terrimicrobiaceae bacterium]|nr:hypothetical protein [Terrimicrobiaceae bacterium]